MRTELRSRRIAFGLAGLAATAVALGLLFGWAPTVNKTSASADDAQVRAVVVRAAHLLQEQTGMPPATYTGGPMSQELRDQIRADSMAAAKAVFQGQALAGFGAIVRDNIAEQASGEVRHLAAGVSRVDITSLKLDGDSATVVATLDVWLEVGQVHASGGMGVAHPAGQTVNTFLLQRIDGTWYVIGHSAQWANGTGP